MIVNMVTENLFFIVNGFPAFTKTYKQGKGDRKF